MDLKHTSLAAASVIFWPKEQLKTGILQRMPNRTRFSNFSMTRFMITHLELLAFLLKKTDLKKLSKSLPTEQKGNISTKGIRKKSHGENLLKRIFPAATSPSTPS